MSIMCFLSVSLFENVKNLCCYFNLQVLQREIPWETYMVTKLISATDLQLLRHYDKKPENTRAQLLDEVNPL